MKITLLIIEFVLSITIVICVLMHSAKGEGLAGIGGQAKMFNSQKGLDSGLTKFTGILCAIFLALALILSVI